MKKEKYAALEHEIRSKVNPNKLKCIQVVVS